MILITFHFDHELIVWHIYRYVCVQSQVATILKAILRDEVIAIYKKRLKDDKPQIPHVPLIDANGVLQPEPENVINMDDIIERVNKATTDIMVRLNNIARFDKGEQRMYTLVKLATNPDNLCRMDPAWHPWV